MSQLTEDPTVLNRTEAMRQLEDARQALNTAHQILDGAEEPVLALAALNLTTGVSRLMGTLTDP